MSWFWIACQISCAYACPSLSAPGTGSSDVPGGGLSGLDRCGTPSGRAGPAWFEVSGAGGGGTGVGGSPSALGLQMTAVASAATPAPAILAVVRGAMFTSTPVWSCPGAYVQRTPSILATFGRRLSIPAHLAVDSSESGPRRQSQPVAQRRPTRATTAAGRRPDR